MYNCFHFYQSVTRRFHGANSSLYIWLLREIRVKNSGQRKL